MTIKFQKFPYLVQEHVIMRMNSVEILILSFCSSKTKKTIKSTNWKLPTLTVSLNDSLVVVALNDTREQNLVGFAVETVQTFLDNTEALKLKGSDLEFRLTKRKMNDVNRDLQIIQVLEEFRVNSRSEIFKHFYELLRNKPTVILCLETRTSLNELPPLVNVTEMELFGAPVNRQYVEDYFEKCDELNCAVVGNDIYSQLNENSKLTSAKYLFFEYSEIQAMLIPFHFKGRVAVFKESICDSSIVISILQRWINSEGLIDLDYMQILLMREYSFNHFHVHREIESEPWDQMRRPARFEKKTRIINWDILPLNCEHFLDVTRRSDGMVGSFLITPKSFTFCIWK
ncbi:unnamed protein product [Caenorhabditis brenneri]